MVGDIKHIVIIESLINERLTGLEIYNDCIKPRIDHLNKPFTHKYHSTKTKSELIDLLKFYQKESLNLRNGLLLHFETHGATNKTGLILADNSLFEWKLMTDLLRPINIATCNGLFITMANCFGRYLSNGIDLNKKAPYSGYISARTAIYPSEIVDKFSILFEKLLENGNLVESYLEMHKNESNFYYKDSKRTFDKAFEKMITDFNNDPVYKANLLKKNFEQVKKETGRELTNSELELTYKAVMVDMYDKMIKGFEFENCE
ncbi:hypothetical protein [Aquimarina agarivorans]|uniref:hypothetical protein n=1 Tax=Aquimarina agarivorans TaxID=980584 RepID=UPI000248F85B|nr:hypothetical protein [Aquimarina agarivorans]